MLHTVGTSLCQVQMSASGLQWCTMTEYCIFCPGGVRYVNTLPEFRLRCLQCEVGVGRCIAQLSCLLVLCSDASSGNISCAYPTVPFKLTVCGVSQRK